MVKTRLEQLSTAYGLSAGLKVAWAMACFHDSIQMDHPTFLMHLHDTASTLLRVASSFGSRSRVRRKKQSDGGRSAMDVVFSRAVVEGTTSRSVSESILVALETPEGEHTITHILRVALMGSLPTCVQRPSGEVRCMLASMTTSQLKELAKRIPHDTPIVGAALVEFSDFCINSGEAPGVLDLIGGAQRWTERASRAGSFLNIIRGGLSKSWGESDDLFGCITNGEISESARRVNKRSSNHQPLVAAPSKLRVLELAVKSTPSDREPSSATIVEALNATDASGLSSVPPDELSALAGLMKRIKSDASVTIISDGDSTSEPMRLLMCTTCMVLKNFAVKMTDAKSNFVTAGFRKMSAPNPLDSDPRPCCVETPACAR